MTHSIQELDVSGARTPLQNAAVLPLQFTSPATSKLDGVGKLMAAVLSDAIRCFCKNYPARCVRELRLYREAADWLFGADDSHVFAFEDVCDSIGIDPDALREDLVRWRERQGHGLRRARKTRCAPRLASAA